MRNLKNRGTRLLLAILILATTVFVPELDGVNAAISSNIKIYNFIKLTVQALDLEVDNTSKSPYLNAALKAGIVKEGDFADYSKYITRTDAAVILNRADEYLYENTVSDKLLDTVLTKRISDINKIAKGKREAVAKIYAKGFMKGYSNGYYIQSREFRGGEYMTTAGSKSAIALLKNKKNRAKLSPDGQLIRTTNLPKNYKDYNYILETYPNSFYEKEFRYQGNTYYFEPEELVHYASPKRFRDISFHGKDMKIILDKNLDIWMDRVETNLQQRLNVDYRTVDDKWINMLRSTYTYHDIASQDKKETDKIKAYVKNLKKNKIILQSKIIAVEPSALYKDMSYFVRVYIKFKVNYDGSKLTADDLIYGDTILLPGLKKDIWFEGVFDIRLGTINGTSDGSDYYVTNDSLITYLDD